MKNNVEGLSIKEVKGEFGLESLSSILYSFFFPVISWLFCLCKMSKKSRNLIRSKKPELIASEPWCIQCEGYCY